MMNDVATAETPNTLLEPAGAGLGEIKRQKPQRVGTLRRGFRQSRQTQCDQDGSGCRYLNSIPG